METIKVTGKREVKRKARPGTAQTEQATQRQQQATQRQSLDRFGGC